MANPAPSEGLHPLIDAVMTVGSDLDLSAMLDRIVAAAANLVGAQYAALGVLDQTGSRLDEFVTVGIDEAAKAAIGPLPAGHGILGVLIVDARPLRLPDLARHPDSFGFPPRHPEMRSFLGVPIKTRDKVFGNLYLTNKLTGDEFTVVDEELVVALAAAAAVAIENARLHHRVRELVVLEDRERIARDLHDTVIQQIFATGLSLQGALRFIQDGTAASRVEAAIDDLDRTVRQVRSVIFELGQRPGRASDDVRGQVLAVVAEAARPLGFEPRVVFDGPVATVVPPAVAGDLLATLREALTNVARHACATRVQIEVVAGGTLTLRVCDDGVGLPTERHPGGRGLANMATRARTRGGDLRLSANGSTGTVVEWEVPLP